MRFAGRALNAWGTVAYFWYPIWTGAAALWVLFDARRRLVRGWAWAAGAALAGPVGLAAYLALRPLRSGETRRGGLPWQVLSRLALWWNALAAWAALWNVAVPFTDFAPLAALWAAPACAALVGGLASRRKAAVERGPTGRLRLLHFPAETTSDGKAYVCLECGNEYSMQRPFCEVCGAWPGQSG